VALSVKLGFRWSEALPFSFASPFCIVD
jgi:hypothetical protein